VDLVGEEDGVDMAVGGEDGVDMAVGAPSKI